MSDIDEAAGLAIPVQVTMWVGAGGKKYASRIEAAESTIRGQIEEMLLASNVYWRDPDLTDVVNLLLEKTEDFARMAEQLRAERAQIDEKSGLQ